MADFQAKVTAILDTSKIQTTLDSATSNLKVKLSNFTLDTSALPSKIQASLNSHKFTIYLDSIKMNNIDSQMQSAGASAGLSFSQSFVNKINTQISTGKITSSVAQVQAQYEKLSSTGHASLTKIEADIETLISLQNQLTSATDSKTLVTTYQKYVTQLETVKNSLKTVKAESQSFATQLQINTQVSKMTTWLNSNTKAASTYGATIESLISQCQALNTADSTSAASLRELSAEFENVKLAATSAGLTGKSFATTISNAFKSITKYVSVITVITTAINAIKEGISTIVDLDTALVDLQKTSDATTAELEAFYEEANEIAKELGSTTEEIIQAAADWSRLGYSLADSETMAEVSSIFASISPDLEVDEATEGLISAMKAFGIEAEDALDGVVSKINIIGNTQAVSNGDIVDIITRSSAAMAEANNTLEETIALGTAATEITQDAESVGTALKTISMRIRGYDEDTEEYVGGIEELSGTIADLTKTASTPGGISLFTDETKTEYKSTTQLLREISEIYDELTDADQASLLEALAGKRQGQVVAAIISNFDTVEDALASMADSEGNALEEMEIIEQSLEYKLNALSETAVGIWQNLIDSDGLGTAIDILTKFLEIIDAITEHIGLFGTVLVGINIGAFIKNFKQIQNLGTANNILSGLGDGVKDVNAVSEAIEYLTVAQKANVVAGTELNAYQKAQVLQQNNVAAATTAATLAKTKCSQQTAILAMEEAGYTKEEIQAAIATTTFATSQNTATTATTIFKTALTSLKTTVSGVWTLLKTNPMSMATAAFSVLTIAISAITTAVQKYKQAQEEASEAIIEAGESAAEETANIRDLYSTYKDAQSAYDGTETSKEALEDASYALLEALGYEESEIESLIGDYSTLSDTIDDVTYDSLLSQVSSITAAYQEAQEQAEKASTENGAFGNFTMQVTEDDYSDFAQALADYGFELTKGGTLVSFSRNETFDSDYEGLVAEYEDLQALQTALADEFGTTFTSSNLNLQIQSEIDSVSEEIEAAEALGEELRDIYAQLNYANYIKTATIDSQEAFDEMRQTLIDAQLNDENLYFGTEEEITAAVDSYLSSLSELDEYTGAVSSNVSSSVEDMLDELANIDELDADGVQDWLATLSEEDLTLVYNLAIEAEDNGATDVLSQTLEEWQADLAEAQEDSVKISDYLDEDFLEVVDEYKDKMTTLQEALEDYKNGDFSNEDLIDLIEDFPELADQADNLDEAIIELAGDLDDDMLASFESQFGDIEDLSEDDVAALEAFEAAVLSLGEAVGNTAFSIDIDTEIDSFDELYDAINESVSATGLSAESVANLKARYEDLESFNAAELFEYTANGIHLNTEALRELEAAYEEQTSDEIYGQLDDLIEEYNSLTEEINSCSDATENAELYSQREDVLNQIEEVAELASEYEGLTSAFNKWEEAQDTANEGDMYDSLTDSLEDIAELYEEGLVGTDDFRTAVQLMSNEDLSTASIDELIEAYETGYSKMERYFTDSSDGCLNFLNDLQDLNSEWVSMNEDGSWEINFGMGNDEEIADALGLNVETVQSILRKLSDYGFDIDLDSDLSVLIEELEDLGTVAEEANEALIEVGATDIDFDFSSDDIDDLNDQLEDAKDVLDSLYDDNGELNVNYSEDDVENAIYVIEQLLYRKQSLDDATVLSVDTSSANTDLEVVIGKLQDFKSAYNNLEVLTAIGADTTDAEAECSALMESISTDYAEIATSLNLDTTSVDTMIASIDAIDAELLVDCGLDTSLIDGYVEEEHTTTGTVTWDNNIDKVTSWINESHTASGTVNWKNDTSNVKKTFTAKGTITWSASATGTANPQGTAYASGDWSVGSRGVSLGGEIGRKYLRQYIVIYIRKLSNCWKTLRAISTTT